MGFTRACGVLVAFAVLAPGRGRADERVALAPDARTTELRHLDLPYSFPAPRTLDEWRARASFLRTHILASTGLLPLPPRGDLRAQVFGRVDHGDYTVEKVFFESLPGFYVTGNLYRPKGASGRRPAILNPHGHWNWGRLENTPWAPGPCAPSPRPRQGYVAFAWDMVGFGDSRAIGHDFGGPREALWGLSLMGLQAWNSLRAVDFVSSLPDVDASRLGCTGESGGGTQTFMLSALDERVKAASPVNMISAHMQGGCLCENAPNLRVITNNVEMGALMAPRPLFMVAATGDWTKDTLTVEYPAIRGVYRLFGAEERVRAVQFDAPHNYDQRSREAVYGFFAQAFQGRPTPDPIPEGDQAPPPLADLMVFYGRPRPEGEVDGARLAQGWIQMARHQIEESLPSDAKGLLAYRTSFGVALQHALLAERPEEDEVTASPVAGAGAPSLDQDAERVVLGRRGHQERVPVLSWPPAAAPAPRSWVIVASLPASPDAATPPARTPLVDALRKAGHGVIAVSLFPGRSGPPPAIKYFTTYNRTDAAHRVQDALTAIAHARSSRGLSSLSVIGVGAAGLPVLLARAMAPPVDRWIVDAEGFDSEDDEAFVARASGAGPPSRRRLPDRGPPRPRFRPPDPRHPGPLPDRAHGERLAPPRPRRPLPVGIRAGGGGTARGMARERTLAGEGRTVVDLGGTHAIASHRREVVMPRIRSWVVVAVLVVMSAARGAHAGDVGAGLGGILLRFFSPDNPVVLQTGGGGIGGGSGGGGGRGGGPAANHAAHFVSQPAAQQILTQLNSGIAAQLSTFPLGSSSAGFTYTFDSALGVFNRSTETFGPIFAERPVTAGKGKFSFGVNYQKAHYDQFEGRDLQDGDIQLFLVHQDVNNDRTNLFPWFEGDIIRADLSVDLQNETTVFFANYGVTDRFDIGMAIPYQRLDLTAQVFSQRGAGLHDPAAHDPPLRRRLGRPHVHPDGHGLRHRRHGGAGQVQPGPEAPRPAWPPRWTCACPPATKRTSWVRAAPRPRSS